MYVICCSARAPTSDVAARMRLAGQFAEGVTHAGGTSSVLAICCWRLTSACGVRACVQLRPLTGKLSVLMDATPMDGEAEGDTDAAVAAADAERDTDAAAADEGEAVGMVAQELPLVHVDVTVTPAKSMLFSGTPRALANACEVAMYDVPVCARMLL